jgi:hypothetical protein
MPKQSRNAERQARYALHKARAAMPTLATVEPPALGDFIKAEAAKPLRSPKPQAEPPAGGLWDECARRQKELF